MIVNTHLYRGSSLAGLLDSGFACLLVPQSRLSLSSSDNGWGESSGSTVWAGLRCRGKGGTRCRHAVASRRDCRILWRRRLRSLRPQLDSAPSRLPSKLASFSLFLSQSWSMCLFFFFGLSVSGESPRPRRRLNRTWCTVSPQDFHTCTSQAQKLKIWKNC
jgi:hypothetical protein